MAMGSYSRIIAVAMISAFACGCGGQNAADSSGSLVSKEGQIAFTRATSVAGKISSRTST